MRHMRCCAYEGIRRTLERSDQIGGIGLYDGRVGWTDHGSDGEEIFCDLCEAKACNAVAVEAEVELSSTVGLVVHHLHKADQMQGDLGERLR